MPVEVAQQTGIEAWINQYGNIIYFFGQLVFWLALAGAADLRRDPVQASRRLSSRRHSGQGRG